MGPHGETRLIRARFPEGHRAVGLRPGSLGCSLGQTWVPAASREPEIRTSRAAKVASDPKCEQGWALAWRVADTAGRPRRVDTWADGKTNSHQARLSPSSGLQSHTQPILLCGPPARPQMPTKRTIRVVQRQASPPFLERTLLWVPSPGGHWKPGMEPGPGIAQHPHTPPLAVSLPSLLGSSVSSTRRWARPWAGAGAPD